MVHCAEPGSLGMCTRGANIGVWLSLSDTTTSQFLGDIVECNPFIFPVNSVLKLVTCFAVVAQNHNVWTGLLSESVRNALLSFSILCLQLCNLEASGSTKWLLKYWEIYKHLFFYLRREISMLQLFKCYIYSLLMKTQASLLLLYQTLGLWYFVTLFTVFFWVTFKCNI